MLTAAGLAAAAAAGAGACLDWNTPGHAESTGRPASPARPAHSVPHTVPRPKPPAPSPPVSLVSRQVLPDEVRLRFSGPLRPLARGAASPPAAGVTLASPGEVAARRGYRDYHGILQVAGTDGVPLRVPLTVPALAQAPLNWIADDRGGAVYITIDDGWFPGNAVLGLMRDERLPLTTFLIQDAAAAHRTFWKAFACAGGLIMNHTLSHPYLTGLPRDQVGTQWSSPAGAYPAWFGQAPTVGRPPYGATDSEVAVQASKSGLDALVMWDVTIRNGRVQTWGTPVQAGDIILLHWTPGLDQDLRQILDVVRDRHLRPALLTPDRLVHPDVLPSDR